MLAAGAALKLLGAAALVGALRVIEPLDLLETSATWAVFHGVVAAGLLAAVAALGTWSQQLLSRPVEQRLARGAVGLLAGGGRATWSWPDLISGFLADDPDLMALALDGSTLLNVVAFIGSLLVAAGLAGGPCRVGLCLETVRGSRQRGGMRTTEAARTGGDPPTHRRPSASCWPRGRPSWPSPAWSRCTSSSASTPGPWARSGSRPGTVELGPAGMMMMTLMLSVVTVQWAVQAARAEDRPHGFIALGVTLMFGAAVINQFWFVYQDTAFAIDGGRAELLFYAVTGSFIAMLIAAMAMLAVTTIRSLMGPLRARSGPRRAGLSLVLAHVRAVLLPGLVRRVHNQVGAPDKCSPPDSSSSSDCSPPSPQAALVYGYTTGGNHVGPISLGWKGGVGDHIGYGVLVGLATVSLTVSLVLVSFRDADAAAQARLQNLAEVLTDQPVRGQLLAGRRLLRRRRGRGRPGAAPHGVRAGPRPGVPVPDRVDDGRLGRPGHRRHCGQPRTAQPDHGPDRDTRRGRAGGGA